MAIREDLVASAAKFLQDPSVSSSPPESRVAFLKAKNLTPEEITAALAQANLDGPTPSYAVATVPQPSPPQRAPGPQQPYYGYGQQQPMYPPYGWQPPSQQSPRRDWRDWFIMATVVGGVGYGLFSLTKRYVYPLVAPPTPDRLEQDKKEINEQFDRAFALVDQLAKDTEALKAAEQERSTRIDAGLAMLETALTDLKSAGKRREEDAERLRDDVRNLKDALPRAMDSQREVTDGRLREVNAELKGLKTLIGQRMTTSGPSAVGGGANPITSISSTYPRPASVPAAVVPGDASQVAKTETEPSVPGVSAVNNGFVNGYSAANLGSSGISSQTSSLGKASIPAWQRAMLAPSASVTPAAPATPATPATPTPTTETAEEISTNDNTQQEASTSA